MPASQRTQLFQTLSVLLLIVISLLFAYEGWLPQPWSWLVVFGALLVFFQTGRRTDRGTPIPRISNELQENRIWQLRLSP